MTAPHQMRQRRPRLGRDRNARRSGSEREEPARCRVSSKASVGSALVGTIASRVGLAYRMDGSKRWRLAQYRSRTEPVVPRRRTPRRLPVLDYADLGFGHGHARSFGPKGPSAALAVTVVSRSRASGGLSSSTASSSASSLRRAASMKYGLFLVGGQALLVSGLRFVQLRTILCRLIANPNWRNSNEHHPPHRPAGRT